MRGRLGDPDLTLGELMETWPETICVFLAHRMLCVGCLVNPFHSIADACREYDLNQSDFVQELMDAITATASAGTAEQACAGRKP